MIKSKKTLIFSIIIITLILINCVLLGFALNLFPEYGGFSRQILFIKPNEETNQEGYFIVIDEINKQAQNFDIDWLIHSRGNLSVAPNQQSLVYKVQSYLSDDMISLNVSFLEDIQQIKSGPGIFCPKNYREGDNYLDVNTSYIKARYSGTNYPIMSTVLYPKNDSDITQQIPIIKKLNNGLKRIGDHDFLYYQEKHKSVQFSNPNIEFTGKLFFLRRNQSEPTTIEYCYLQDASYLKFENDIIFQSSNPLINILISYSNSSQISGYINGKNSQIGIYNKFTPQMIKIDGVNSSISYAENITALSISDSSSFVISNSEKYYNPEINELTIATPMPSMPEKDIWGIDMNVFTGLTHPYILYNLSELEELRNKVSDTNKPWYNWTDEYIGDISIELSRDPDFYEDDERRHAVYKLAFNFALESDASVLNKLKEYLLDMGSITHYSADLRRAKSVEAYAIAFDMIYQNLTSNEQSTIYNLLYEHAEPLKRMDLYHRNNHRVVDAGALGLAGLVLQDEQMINIAMETCLDYFYNQNPADGGSFEGYSYMAFAFFHMSQFTTGLKRLGVFNFYEDSQILASYDYIAETLGPLGMPGSFEDCTFDKNIQEVLLFAAAQVNNTRPEKAAKYQYIWEQRQDNSQYNSTSDFGYLLGGDPSFHRILLYNLNDTIQAKPLERRREVWKDSSMAYLRSGNETGLFMPFSCKNYDQNHPHQDENSFELWAYGAYIANNPGYPGWGKKFHTWSQSTEGSNSLLIGGSDQLQVAANGLTTSISSSYFSTVIGSGEELYNDLGSFRYTPEFYLLIIANFVMIFLCGIIYIIITKNISFNMLRFKHPKRRFKNKKNEEKRDKVNKNTSKGKLLGLAFIKPYKLQKILYREENFEKNWKFLIRFTNLFLGGIVVLIFLISCFDINNTIIYHSQYHEDKYDIVFDILEFAIPLIFIVGSLIVGLMAYLSFKIFKKSNRLIIDKIIKDNKSPEIDKRKIACGSSLSFLWLFPMIIFAGFLIYFTSVQELKGAIHGLWTELNSLNDVYDILVSVLIGVIRNFALIMLFELPFLIFSIPIFSKGIDKISRGKISLQKAWKIPIIGYMIMFVAIFLSYMVFYIFFKSIFSLITIEAIVN